MASGGFIFLKLRNPIQENKTKFLSLIKGMEDKLFNPSGWHVSDDANNDWKKNNPNLFNGDYIFGEYGDHRDGIGSLDRLMYLAYILYTSSYTFSDYDTIDCKQVTMDLFVANCQYVEENKTNLNSYDDFTCHMKSWDIPKEIAKMTVYDWASQLLGCIEESFSEETWT